MNGVAERMIQNLNSRVRSIMIDANIPMQFWAELINTAIYLQARTPTAALQGKTPYETLHEKLAIKRENQNAIIKPDISHLRRIGCTAYHRIPDESFRNKTLQKLGPRSKKCMLLGYTDSTKIWKLWDPSGNGGKGRIIRSTDVIFKEEENAMTETLGDAKMRECENAKMRESEKRESENARMRESEMRECEKAKMRESEKARMRECEKRESENARMPECENARMRKCENAKMRGYEKQESGKQENENARMQEEEKTTQENTIQNEEIIQEREAMRERDKAMRIERMTKEQATLALNSHVIEQLNTSNLPTDPTTFQEAMNSPFREQWIRSMREELGSLHENKTWECTDTNLETHAIGSKWVFKTKPNPDGTVRFKSRLVVKGYKQIKDIDFKETYAPVSRLATLRITLAFASEKNWECHQMDLVTAFLNPKIDQENILMKLPKLNNLGSLAEFNLAKPSTVRVVRLKKALYGLKQAPRLWFIEINSYLLSLGFSQSTVEPNLYISDSAIILLYVDDMLIFFKEISTAHEIKQKLQKKYKMTDLGPVKRFLGMTVERTKNGYRLHQETYIDSLLQKNGMTDCYDASTPIETHAKLETNSEDTDAPVDQKSYLAIVGSLMYAALGTRPDISYAVGLLSRFNSDPKTRHLTAAKRVLRYLKKTKNLKLEYKQTGEKLQGYVDSDWGSEKNRKSVGGYIFSLGGAAVSWASKKQTLVALSTEEAEYTAFTEGSREALWIKQLLSDFKLADSEPLAPADSGDKAITIYADNQSALKHVRTEGITARTKHFDIRLQHSRDNQSSGIITFEYIKSANNTADILTKALPLPAHQRHLEGLGLSPGNDC